VVAPGEPRPRHRSGVGHGILPVGASRGHSAGCGRARRRGGVRVSGAPTRPCEAEATRERVMRASGRPYRLRFRLGGISLGAATPGTSILANARGERPCGPSPSASHRAAGRPTASRSRPTSAGR
jgi:hypothetical protein